MAGAKDGLPLGYFSDFEPPESEDETPDNGEVSDYHKQLAQTLITRYDDCVSRANTILAFVKEHNRLDDATNQLVDTVEHDLSNIEQKHKTISRRLKGDQNTH